MRVNVPKATRVLRACLVAALDIQLNHYSSLPTYRNAWAARIARDTINSFIGFFPRHFPEEAFRAELRRTAANHLAQRSKPVQRVVQKQIDRKELRDSYFEAFPEVRILDLCWAAGQHYSEWKRWLRRAVKDGSAPDRAFHTILTSSKSPQQFRKQPRPKGWK